jgi:antitoxin YefM
MRISSYSEFRRNPGAAIDRVNADREPLIITRDRGKPMAVLMSLEDFASYEETRHLLRSAKNEERLLEAIGELERGGGNGAGGRRVRLVFSERAWEDYLYWQANVQNCSRA